MIPALVRGALCSTIDNTVAKALLLQCFLPCENRISTSVMMFLVQCQTWLLVIFAAAASAHVRLLEECFSTEEDASVSGALHGNLWSYGTTQWRYLDEIR